MDERRNNVQRPVKGKRRKRTKMDIFKEVYLPLIIVGLAAAMLLVIIIGSITRAVQRKQVATEESIAASIAQAELDAEAQNLIDTAKEMATHFDYEGAMALFDGFAESADYPEMATLRAQYEYAMSQLVAYEDPNSIPNLSFNSLIVDASRAFASEEHGSSLKKNYITITEFENILQQLYNNNYILVDPHEFVTTGVNDFGLEAYVAQPIMLPAGKKPIILTQTNLNYETYLIDGNGDKIADEAGLGFASRMVIGDDGNVVCEYIDATGQTHVGAYDLVPILDAFVEDHPDFSYKGAKAILALSGHDGLFGYRTNVEAENYFGTAVYELDVADATSVAQALKESGYSLACYTYGNSAYGNIEATEIQDEMNLWNSEVTPIIGDTDTIVFAQDSDISDGIVYMGEKHNVLQDQGFRYYIGFCGDPSPWTIVVDDYIRQGRIKVNGATLTSDTEWFTGIFDVTLVLDTAARESE